MFDFKYMIESIPDILRGVPISLSIAIIAIFFGLIIGTTVALIRIYEIPVLNQIAKLYVSFLRGTPLLVQIFLCYYGIPAVINSINTKLGTEGDISQIPAIIFIYISLSLNVSAFLSETIRGAILSVPKGQMEGAYSVGMTSYQAMKIIIIPQALRHALPNFSNIFISILKDTSLAFAVAVPEIMGEAKIIAGRTSKFFEVYIVAALIYWVLCIVLERVFLHIEKRMTKYERGNSYAKNS